MISCSTQENNICRIAYEPSGEQTILFCLALPAWVIITLIYPLFIRVKNILLPAFFGVIYTSFIYIIPFGAIIYIYYLTIISFVLIIPIEMFFLKKRINSIIKKE
tara:strand:+ start:142 stop:456 length:315 start_codon:yes stop_codon:yes gene_type:complete